jgi:hypothetical protein
MSSGKDEKRKPIPGAVPGDENDARELPPAEERGGVVEAEGGDIFIAPEVVVNARIAALKAALEMRSGAKPARTVIAEAQEFEHYLLAPPYGAPPALD